MLNEIILNYSGASRTGNSSNGHQLHNHDMRLFQMLKLYMLTFDSNVPTESIVIKNLSKIWLNLTLKNVQVHRTLYSAIYGMQ